MPVQPPIKWHGGKHYLAKKIIALMPPRCKDPNAPATDDPGWLHYVEPYAGGLAVLLENDPEGISEVVNDLNANLINFWMTLASAEKCCVFQRLSQATPFAEDAFRWSDGGGDTGIEKAWAFFIRCRQSLSGRMDAFAGITRNRTRRGMNEQVSAWLNAVEGLPAVHARLKRVLILNRPAVDVIRKEDGPRTLFYLDPPYLHETRATTGEYAHEMTDQDHSLLLQELASLKGRFLLSGYHSKLYDGEADAHGWKCHEFELPNNAAGGKDKRRMTECVWTNF
jgi:DNA adenine methylase